MSTTFSSQGGASWMRPPWRRPPHHSNNVWSTATETGKGDNKHRGDRHDPYVSLGRSHAHSAAADGRRPTPVAGLRRSRWAVQHRPADSRRDDRGGVGRRAVAGAPLSPSPELLLLPLRH
eukprot:TRINITY_DN4366_c0_g1_i4.p3 TRINITY_DN4366_c0_g1~~TRINITY_DN4366_c0_g1_i4.p3  ORF type:complete len:120 (-),score=1.37 TRINITY_DN4366_c0_g1_i4:691-1050(-)